MNARTATAAALCAGVVVIASACDPTKPPTYTIEVGKVITIHDGDPLPTVRAIDRLDVVLTWSEDIYERCARMGGHNRWNGRTQIATCEGVDPASYPLRPIVDECAPLTGLADRVMRWDTESTGALDVNPCQGDAGPWSLDAAYGRCERIGGVPVWFDSVPRERAVSVVLPEGTQQLVCEHSGGMFAASAVLDASQIEDKRH